LVARIADLTARRPRLVVLGALGVLLTMAIPVLSINLGTADSGTAPASTTQRKAYDLVADAFGPGVNGPLFVAVDQGSDPAAANKLAAAFAATSGVAKVASPVVNESGDTAQVVVVPTSSPQSTETSDLVTTLRDEVIPNTLGGTDAHAYVGGSTA